MNNIEFIGSHKGYDFIVRVNLMGYRCGYVKISGTKFERKEMNPMVEGGLSVNVHGGVTFQGCFKDKNLYFGWDYGHYDDLPMSKEEFINFCKSNNWKEGLDYAKYLNPSIYGLQMLGFHGHHYSLEEVCEDCIDAINQLKSLENEV